MEVVARYGPGDGDARLFPTADQVPAGLVIPGIEHHTVVHFEVRRLNRKLSAFQIFGCGYNIANALTDPGGDHARVLQLSEADRDINIFRDRKSTRLNSSHQIISYAVFCLKKKKQNNSTTITSTAHSAH